MAWTVILENEERQPVMFLSKEFTIESSDKNAFKLLQYLDPFGDAIFNYLQMDDLIDDLLQLNEKSMIVNELISLSEKCKQERHTYLVFYGD